jgi:hypothetical protein
MDFNPKIPTAAPVLSYKPSLAERTLIGFFHFVNKFVSWDKFPGVIGSINLEALRVELRAYNLHDGYASGTAQSNQPDEPMIDKRFENARNSDGKFNSKELPLMGCSGMRFGRNFQRADTPKPTEKELWNPNPRMLSERFMTRKPGEFIPATSLNLLAASWIQFQTHDWFVHENVRSIFLNGVDNFVVHLTDLNGYRTIATSMSYLLLATNGRTARWSCRGPSQTKYCTRVMWPVQGTRILTRRGGITLRFTDPARLSRNLCGPVTMTANCCSQKKEGKRFYPVMLLVTY